jgi:hypothetical protein
MTNGITWVGLDAHKKAINVAVLVAHERQPQEWIVENKPAALRRLVKKLVREADGGEVRCCYEAGPCGYALQRQIEAEGPVICEVIAPALIPRKPGERIKTDLRDARKLAELLRAGRSASADAGARSGAGSVPGPRGCQAGSAALPPSPGQTAAAPRDGVRGRQKGVDADASQVATYREV